MQTTAAPAAVILVEGNIGSGKTSLCRALAAQGAARHVQECAGPRMQRLFYGDPMRYGFALQMSMQAQRAARLLHETSAAYTANIELSSDSSSPLVLLDRSVVGDWAFTAYNYACGNLTGDEVNAYQECAGPSVYDAYLRAQYGLGPYPTVLYLNDAASRCLERARARNGPDAGTLQDAYVAGLAVAHDICVMQLQAECAPVIVMDWGVYARAAVDERAARALAETLRAGAPSERALTREETEERARTLCALIPDQIIATRLLQVFGYSSSPAQPATLK